MSASIGYYDKYTGQYHLNDGTVIDTFSGPYSKAYGSGVNQYLGEVGGQSGALAQAPQGTYAGIDQVANPLSEKDYVDAYLKAQFPNVDFSDWDQNPADRRDVNGNLLPQDVQEAISTWKARPEDFGPGVGGMLQSAGKWFGADFMPTAAKVGKVVVPAVTSIIAPYVGIPFAAAMGAMNAGMAAAESGKRGSDLLAPAAIGGVAGAASGYLKGADGLLSGADTAANVGTESLPLDDFVHPYSAGSEWANTNAYVNPFEQTAAQTPIYNPSEIPLTVGGSDLFQLNSNTGDVDRGYYDVKNPDGLVDKVNTPGILDNLPIKQIAKAATKALTSGTATAGGSGLLGGAALGASGNTGTLAKASSIPIPQYAQDQTNIPNLNQNKQKTWQDYLNQTKLNQKGYYGGFLA